MAVFWTLVLGTKTKKNYRNNVGHIPFFVVWLP